MLRFSGARSEGEVRQAEDLITRVYRRSGYIPAGEEARSKISSHLFSPDAVTFLAYMDEDLIGTISVVPDSERGIPMYEIFPAELDAFRKAGLSFAEVAQFAVDKELLEKLREKTAEPVPDMAISIPLFKLVVHHGLKKGFDLFCISVNPKHEPFYRTLGFEQFGDVREYPSVENAPAVPMKLSLKQLEQDWKDGKPLNWVFKEILGDSPKPKRIR